MKNKNILTKIIFILLILGAFISCNLNVYATDSIMQGADEFLEMGKSEESILDVDSIKNVSDTLFNIFSVAGTVVVVIVGAILGLQFIMGSTEEKAKIKETLIPFIVGSAVIFGAVIIWKVVLSVAKGIF